MKHLHFSLALLSLFTVSSCGLGNGSAESDSTASEEESNTLSIAVGIPQKSDSESCADLFYMVKETPDSIHILPGSGNFADYESPDELEFHPERDIYCSDLIENPNLEVYITNNSDETITADILRVSVESSTLDTFPYLYIQQEYNLRYGMRILNESWSNWGNMTIEYSFLKKDEKFDGDYTFKLTVPYFEDEIVLDFINDLRMAGLDTNKFEPFLEPGDPWLNEEYQNLRIDGHGMIKSDVYSRELKKDISTDQLSKLAYPYSYGYAYDTPFIYTEMHARLSFSNHPFTKKIRGIIPLTTVLPGGADNSLVDKFDIELRPVGRNYSFDLPYVTTLRPGESERIQIGIKCEKSSHHNLRLQLRDQDTEILQSKPIHFYNVNGRHSSYHVLKSWEEE